MAAYGEIPMAAVRPDRPDRHRPTWSVARGDGSSLSQSGGITYDGVDLIYRFPRDVSS